ncbi:MAG: MmgE/PrpD family protein [Pseudomonadota bacterium]
MNIQTGIRTDIPPADAFAAFAVRLAHDAVPDEVRTRAVHHMLDAAGIAVASAQYPFAAPVLAGLQALGDRGHVPVFGMDANLSPRDAAIMNGYLGHGLDYDDTHISAMTHATVVILPVCLSAAALAGASGREMVTAYIIGIEAAARIGTCAKSAFHQIGYHPTGIVGTMAASIAAGRLLGLSAEQIAMAQGIALSQASGSMQFLETGAWTKRFHPGWAAQSGLVAASLAKAGMVGAEEPYEGRFGFFNLFAGTHRDWVDMGELTEGLGTRWEMMDTGIKPFPTCHLTHGAIDAALSLHNQLDPSQIVSITARVPHQANPVVCDPIEKKHKPTSDYEAKFSLHYLVAAALMRGRLTLDELEPEVFTDPALLALTAKVQHADMPGTAFPEVYPGGVTVTMDDGSTVSAEEPVNRGAADRPLSNAEIVAKYRHNAAIGAGPEKVAAMEAAMLGLNDAADPVEALRVFSA